MRSKLSPQSLLFLALAAALMTGPVACQKHAGVSTSAQPIDAVHSGQSTALSMEDKRRFEAQALGIDEADTTINDDDSTPPAPTYNGPSNDETLEYCVAQNAEKDPSKRSLQKFVCSMLPGAILLEKQIFIQRLELQRLIAKESQGLDSDDQQWLSDLKKSYTLPENATDAQLLARVDIVPLALMLSQAGIESDWGNSRFAKEALNFFGIHGSVKTDNCVLATGDKSVCMKKYASMEESISDYLHFLNVRDAAANFRTLRAQMRAQNQALDPVKLSSTLLMYSQIGAQYAKEIQGVISAHNFSRFVFQEGEITAQESGPSAP